MSCAINATVATKPVSLPSKKAPPREIPSIRLWKTSPITNNHPWVVSFCLFLSSSWWWWNDLNPFSIRKNTIIATKVASRTSEPPSAIASGKRSLYAIINNTPAAKGVPYLINFDEKRSLPNKNKATDNESKPAAILAKTTTTKSDIFLTTFFHFFYLAITYIPYVTWT